MSNENPLVGPIEDYRITVWRQNGTALTIPLKLNKVGGAHITNAESLIMQIEDAVFKMEASRND